MENVWMGVYEAFGQFVPQWGHRAAHDGYELGCYRTRKEAQRRLVIFRAVGR